MSAIGARRATTPDLGRADGLRHEFRLGVTYCSGVIGRLECNGDGDYAIELIDDALSELEDLRAAVVDRTCGIGPPLRAI